MDVECGGLTRYEEVALQRSYLLFICTVGYSRYSVPARAIRPSLLEPLDVGLRIFIDVTLYVYLFDAVCSHTLLYYYDTARSSMK